MIDAAVIKAVGWYLLERGRCDVKKMGKELALGFAVEIAIDPRGQTLKDIRAEFQRLAVQ